MTQILLTFARRLALAIGFLTPLALTSARAADDFLPPTEAYKYEARIVEGQLVVEYRVHDGYYLYRDKISFESATPGVTLGAPEFPVGIDHEDDSGQANPAPQPTHRPDPRGPSGRTQSLF